MRTSSLIAALVAVLFVLVPMGPPRDPPVRSLQTGVSIEPALRSVRPAARPDRDARNLTAAPRAGDTDRLAAAHQRLRHDPPRLVRVPGTGPPIGNGPLRRYAIEVEAHTGVTPEEFAAAVEAILSDPRSWTAGDRYTLQRVDHGRIDLRVTLASPDSVDALCWPLDTQGTQSCWNEDRAVINAFRWEHGASTYATDLVGYRAYVVNHEVGHGLGREHADCPGPGEVAPVMLQQTITLDGCRPNPWPFPE